MGIPAITPSAAMTAGDAATAAWPAIPVGQALLLLGVVVLAAFVVVAILYRRHLREQHAHLQALREREQRTRLALWASGELYWQYRMDTRELERTHVEPDPGNDLAMHVALDRENYIHPDDLAQVQGRLRDYLRGNTPIFLSEHRIRDTSGGAWQWIRARGRAVERDADGRVTVIAGTARDVTSIREKERERRISGDVMRSMAEAVMVVDADFRFAAVNPAFTRISGYEADDVIGRDLSILDSTQHDRDFYMGVREGIAGNAHWSGEMWQRRKDGRELLCEVRANTLIEPGTGQRLHVMVETDITERRRIEQELRYLANYDTLTNLPNRTLLTERLSRAIVRARRHGSRLALLFLDLDHFKDINDSMGHATGDRILRAAAQRLQEVVGNRHTVARIGGDEFTLVLEDVVDIADAEAYAKRIIEIFDQPIRMDDRHDITITPSIGISVFPDHAQVPTDLLKHADTAMYQAKAAGRRTYLTYVDAMDVDVRRRTSLIASLRRVVERGELELAYQPQMSLDDDRIVGVEALLRWHSPVHGTVPPAQFIPLAEESGLIVAIGEWVLREACLTLAAWRASGADPRLLMSVNVSAVQLLRSDLLHIVQSALDETGLPASALELELTESVLMANAELATERLQAFRELGVSIAIDDFGTGYSSLAYLRRLPIRTLKIDKVFIDGLSFQGDTEDNAITTTIIAMAHTLDMRVVAEGVETGEQLDVLRTHACNRIQGYWLSPPMPADACLAFLRERAGTAA